jgi:membrane-bound serine protease (ClpP class)
LILGGLVGIVFELFHPSNGPAGVTGLAAFAFGVFGVATLGGSWGALAALLVGVTFFCIDLRYERLGAFTLLGALLLIGGSIWLFPSPYLRTSPWILVFGIAAMTAFLLGAMTRVLRDLRAIARGELEVRDAHPHPEIGDD